MKSLFLLGGLWVFNVYMPFLRKDFCNMFLEECLISFKAHEDEKNIFVLWEMVFVICMGSIYRHFFEYRSCIYILCETWSLRIYEKYVWIFCEECVCKIYRSMK